MISSNTIVHPLHIFFSVILQMWILYGGGACLAQDQSTVHVVRVEENWKMVVNNPDPESTAPQVTCVISPVNNVEWLYGAFTLNHRGLPDFSPGGLQLQVWNNETPLYINNSNTSVMATVGETVTWTQSMELKDGQLIFKIADGKSTTWGDFGGENDLQAGVRTNLPDLNNYNPAVSVKNSGIGFASNRVSSLVIEHVKFTLSTGVIVEDNTEKTIYKQQ
jgi:hypothetical protein